MDTRDCMACHVSHPITGTLAQRNRNRPMFAGLSGEMNPPGADWTYVDRLKKMTSMKLVLKGIDTAEDAKLAREHGADGVIVSNHGGRATETGRGTMDILPEVVDAVGGQIPVFVDGGFRRGTDVLKALAIGARAVGIGRPYIWGLSCVRAGGRGAGSRDSARGIDPHDAPVRNPVDRADYARGGAQSRREAVGGVSTNDSPVELATRAARSSFLTLTWTR